MPAPPVMASSYATDSSPMFLSELLRYVFAFVGLLLTVSSAPGEALQSQEETSIPALVMQMKSSDSALRRKAIRQLIILHPPSAVGALRSALRRFDPDVQMRIDIVTALLRIGDAASSALPELLKALSDPEDAVRQAASGALGNIYRHQPNLLFRITKRKLNPEISLGLVRAFKYMKQDGLVSIPFLIQCLQPDVEELSNEAVLALSEVGPGATSSLVKVLHDSKSVTQQSGSADALGRIYLDEGSLTPVSVVNALAEAVEGNQKDPKVRWKAAEALSRIQTKVPRALRILTDVLQKSDEDVNVRGEAARALGASQVSEPYIMAALVAGLESGEDNIAGPSSDALKNLGAPAVQPLATVLEQGRSPQARKYSAQALGGLGPVAAPAVDALIRRLHDPDIDVQTSSAEALQSVGDAAVKAIPEMIKIAEKSPVEEKRWIIEAIADLCKSVQPERDLGMVTDLQRFLTQLHPEEWEDRSEFEISVALPIHRTVDRLNSEVRRRHGYLFGGIAGTMLAVWALLIINVRVQRAVRIWLGQRWVFSAAKCDYTAQVAASDTRIILRLITEQSPQSGIFQWNVEKPEWVRRTFNLAVIRNQLARGSTVRVEVDQDLFGYPWAHKLAGKWTDGSDAIIAGQLCVTSDLLPLNLPASKKLSFAGLYCKRSPYAADVLVAAEDEIATVTAQFRAWGATITLSTNDATINDFLAALRSADVVHLSAHGNASSLCLADGLLTRMHLDDKLLSQLRCRLLILSACHAGTLSTEESLVWRLVRAGVNVLAAIDVVRDRTCETFFEEFYKAMIPTRRAQGIMFAEAVRKACQNCEKRFSVFEKVVLNDHNAQHWKRSIDSFVFYGDPSLHLRLQRPRSGQPGEKNA